MDRETKNLILRLFAAIMGFFVLLGCYKYSIGFAEERRIAVYDYETEGSEIKMYFNQSETEAPGFPGKGHRHQAGTGFELSGSVISTVPIGSIYLEIRPCFEYDSNKLPVSVSISLNENELFADISELNALVDFSLLPPGEYNISLSATDKDRGRNFTLISHQFLVLEDMRQQTSAENFDCGVGII